MPLPCDSQGAAKTHRRESLIASANYGRAEEPLMLGGILNGATAAPLPPLTSKLESWKLGAVA